MGRLFTVTYVCTGNICRSPMGEVVLRDQIAAEGLSHLVEVWSAGTGDWHIGEPADHRALATLSAHGHDGARHRAKQFRPMDFSDADLVLALDRSHQRALTRLARTEEDRGKVRLLRSFDPAASAAGLLDVEDPYFGTRADFEDTYAALVAANRGLIAHVREVLEEWN
jgi:protein-tyrosine phosphatase